MIRLTTYRDGISIRIGGLSKWFAGRSTVIVDEPEFVRAYAASRTEVGVNGVERGSHPDGFGLRFSVLGRAERVLVIETTGEFRRIILQIADPDGTAERITAGLLR